MTIKSLIGKTTMEPAAKKTMTEKDQLLAKVTDWLSMDKVSILCRALQTSEIVLFSFFCFCFGF